jgi:hypothetical protein
MLPETRSNQVSWSDSSDMGWGSSDLSIVLARHWVLFPESLCVTLLIVPQIASCGSSSKCKTGRPSKVTGGSLYPHRMTAQLLLVPDSGSGQATLQDHMPNAEHSSAIILELETQIPWQYCLVY